MRSFRTAVSSALALACLLSAQQEGTLKRDGDSWTETTSGSIATGDAARLRIMMRGVVMVDGASDGRIRYVYTKRVQARNIEEARQLLSSQEIRLGTEAGWVTLTLVEPGWSLVTGELKVEAPPKMQRYEITTRNGGVEAFGLAGQVHIDSAGGQVAAGRIEGPLTARTAGGDIVLASIHGSVNCVTGSGTIRVGEVTGESRLDTGIGDIFVDEAGGPVNASTGGGNVQVGRAHGTVSARTLGGLIKVKEAGGMVTAENQGGGIQIGPAPGAHCESVAGPIRLRGVSGALSASTASGHIIAELQPGKPLFDSYLTTNAGDLTVLIPSNLPVSVEAWTESGPRPGWIVSDFSEIHVRLSGRAGHARAFASGELNGGGPVLRLAAAGGTIYLRRLP